MQAQVKITICKDGERFMGIGPYRLLQLTNSRGSLRQAALEMNMSYSKAHTIIKRLESIVQRPVLTCKVGGVSGGGAQLTEFGYQLLAEYEKLKQRVEEETEVAFADFCANLKLKDL